MNKLNHKPKCFYYFLSGTLTSQRCALCIACFIEFHVSMSIKIIYKKICCNITGNLEREGGGGGEENP